MTWIEKQEKDSSITLHHVKQKVVLVRLVE